ncbi:Salicylate hydroxylase [Pleurostoma richardsiae]|uniref:Salicylate hydroxylase n=1 Tax=Pleurostoma richardsiae TaxID=41990 RepID=A0AA38VP78_9PEZI|nr:Salicylate hydroxylase [Pleurostoma richardsiae]
MSEEHANAATGGASNGMAPLRIAIIGGGLAGAAAAGALSRLPDTQVKVYERSEVVREVGALIAVMVSALKVLRRMVSPAAWEELQRILYRGEGTEGIHHRHWRSGEIMATAISPDTPRHMQEGRTGRAPLLKTLMMDVPDGVVAYGKEVIRVEPRTADGAQGSSPLLHFSDGSIQEADLVVVADGLYSKFRRQYVPDSLPRYKGQVAYRFNFPIELVSDITGLPNDTSAYKRTNEVVFLSALEPGTYSFVAFLNEPKEVADTMRWAHSLGRPGVERLKEKLADWHPLILQVLDVLPSVDAYPLESAPWMEHLIRDECIAFVGDAAHPTAGAFGTGCAFAFSDVWALYRSLHRTHASRPPSMASPNASSSTPPSSRDASPKRSATPGTAPVAYSIPYALHLYDETRRHFLQRAEKQVSLDKLDIEYCAKAIDDYDEYVRRYRETFTINWWLLEHDVDARWQEVEAEERHRYQGKRMGGA